MPGMRGIRLLIVAALLSACGAAPSPSATVSRSPAPSETAAPSSVPEDTAAAATDLDDYLEALERIHPEPFHGTDRDEFVATLEDIQTHLGDRSPEETMVEIMRLVATLSREDGRDGHQLAIPTGDGPMLPIRVFEFADGVFVTDAVDPGLIGARITMVAGHPIDEVLDLLEPLVPRDSPATVPGLRPFYLLRADVLQGLGLVESDRSIELTVERSGEGSTTVVTTIPFSEYATFGGPFGLIHLPEQDGLRFTDFSRNFWIETLAQQTLYVRLTQVRPVPASDLEELRGRLEHPTLTRIILDLRHNPGGDNGTYQVLRSILRDADLPLWVLTDRRTFSAAGNLATELEQARETRFAGEGMGGGLNFWNDVRFMEFEHLPIPMRIGISTRYWQKSVPDDPRLTIDPDLPVEYRSADYFAGRDVGLDAVLSAP